jgi:hypothetical protein
MLHTSKLQLLLVPLFFSSAAWAGVLHVDAALATGANNGSSWVNAFQGKDGLQAALLAAAAGDQIWVAQGLYRPSSTGSRDDSFRLRIGVEIYGGFDGTELTLGERDPAAHVTILSGDLAGDDAQGLLGENSFHVLHGNASNSSAVLDGFTVTGGNANGSGSNRDRGGAILCVIGASPTVRQCLFTANRCTFGGGAGYVNNSSAPSFTDCTFENNLGGSFGGAFDMASNVSASFERCTFRGNSAARAGALEIFGSSPVRVSNSLFHGNTSTGGGGGGALFVSTSNAQIRNCTIVGNSATANAAGGILATGGMPLFVNCVVAGNTGAGGASGAAAQISPATLNVTYTLTEAGYVGTGNVAAVAVFETCATTPFRLQPGSPGVDGGSNAGVAAGATLDLAGQPRFVDLPTVPDTGAGVGALVDMGAYESAVDCNANGTADVCDVLLGTSPDVNQNGLPDECECAGGLAPFAYCTAKVNSLGCLPEIVATGFASASSTLPFTITASKLLNQTIGLHFYGYQAGSAPFQGGTLCVSGPVRRTSLQSSGGSAAGADCTGAIALDFNAYLQAGSDPLLLVVGQQVNVQVWSRDLADPFDSSLSAAVQLQVCQ